MIYSEDSFENTTEQDKLLILEIYNLLAKAYEKFKALPKNIRIRYECHSICRALTIFLDGKVSYVDGYYVVIQKYKDQKPKIYACEHTWLITESGSIIDPFPVGMISFSPLLFVNQGKYRNFANSLYNPDQEVTKVYGTRDMWRRSQVISRLFKTA